MTVIITHSTPSDSSFSTTGATAWDASHTLSGVGTMAEQNANAVTITGGSIDSTTVGATTASTGAFTILSASSTVSGTGFSTYLASPPAIGGTTAAAGTFTTLIGGSGSANYEQITGGAAGKAVQFQSLGTDANISQVFQSKGTGAIDLAAGSSGVNISNGGTVTAITGLTGGSYTLIPTITISAPTTAGGVQATGTVAMLALATTLVSGGSGYAALDTITLTGGTFSQAIVIRVDTVSSGAILTFTVTNGGTYTVLPTNPISQGSTSGSGTGATFSSTWQVRTTAFTITLAGSGYVEQPTITFSSGSATAYATVGAEPTIKSLFGGTSAGLVFSTAYGPQLRLLDIGDGTRPLLVNGGSAGSVNSAGLYVISGSLQLSANASPVSFYTGGRSATEQLRVAHTASAVNYVQVTGSVTSGAPAISAQGSDASIGLSLTSKGTSPLYLQTTGSVDVRVQPQGIRTFGFFSVTNAVNYGSFTSAVAGSSPILAVAGSDADIDLNLTPKGAGAIRFGTYTGTILTPTGYITIKDSGGTTRRLLVG